MNLVHFYQKPSGIVLFVDYGQRQHRKSCFQRQILILTKQFRYPMQRKPRKKTFWPFLVQKQQRIMEATKSVRKSENRKKFQKKHAEECFRCGNNHYFSECRFKESKCLKCQKPGHFSKKCPPRKKPDKPAFFVDRGNGNTSDSEDSICSIFCTHKTDSSNKKFTVKITLGRENVLVDTGSVRTIIGESVLRTPGRMLL